MAMAISLVIRQTRTKTCCLDKYEDQKSESDFPFFKQKIRDVNNGPMTRERPIGAQTEDQELLLACRSQWRRQRRFVFAVL